MPIEIKNESMSREIEDVGNQEVKIVVDSMAENIKEFQERLVNHEQPILSRIPDEIRGKHGSEYEPKIIAIGPYHRNNGGQGGAINPRLLKRMEKLKLQYLIDLCKRDDENGDVNTEGMLKTYTTTVKKQELSARKNYSESSFEMSSEDFVRMLVLDGCFIVELMLNTANEEVKTMPMAFLWRTMASIQQDLFYLFENQIPFFILEEIYAKTNSKPTNVDTFLDLALYFLGRGSITKEMLSEYRREEQPKKIHHLLHLTHICRVSQQDVPKDPQVCVAETLSEHLFLKSIQAMLKSKLCLFLFRVLKIWEWSCWKCFKERGSPKYPSTIPTATQLKEAGVQFRKKEISGSGCFFDVSFKDGIMEIPTANIQSYTSSLYRNFLALEQAHEDYGGTFTSYMVTMDYLIDTADDVALLIESKIIENNRGSVEELAKFYNEMCSYICFSNDHYAEMFVEINKYYNKTYNKWRAKLMHDYLNSPWAVISLLGAVILLSLTAMQTAYSV